MRTLALKPNHKRIAAYHASLTDFATFEPRVELIESWIVQRLAVGSIALLDLRVADTTTVLRGAA
jgi:hypothetical protein